jgi:hypothetical protein
VRCSRCGNENPALNRFCGMCGSTLVAPGDVSAPVAPRPTRAAEPTVPPMPRPAVASAKPAPVPMPAPRLPEPVRPREIEQDSQPIISGPSFLGLNQPARGSSGRGSQSDNAPRSLDYLLEDEEEPKGGAGKAVLIVVALLLALGLGYLRWRNEGLDWLTAGMKKTLGGTSSETSSTPGTNSGGDNSAAANPSATAGAPATNAPTTSDTNSPTGATQPGAQAPTVGGSTAAAPAGGSNPNNDAVIPVDSNAGAKTPADAAANGVADKGTAANPAAEGGSDTTDAGNAASAPAVNPKKASGRKAAADAEDDAENSDDAEPAPAAARPTPLAKPHAAKPLDVVAEGERYIYGRGVAQDCDRGVKMVRQEANQSNAKAMISLGALYSAGLCTPRDLPTAYRWFAVALRREPENDSLQGDLKKLWSEMTPPERQLAIKLSQ